MRQRVSQIVLVLAVALLYAAVAVHLPYLLVDHYSGLSTGDPNHSAADTHVWLEWVADASLSDGKHVFFIAEPFIGPVESIAAQPVSSLLPATRQSRAPPIL